MARFVLEGMWRGYRSSQDQVVHREVVDGSRKKFLEWARKTFCIRYTDGTTLELSVRPCVPRERVAVKKGYTSLIYECFHYNVGSVDALYAAKEASEKAREEAKVRSQMEPV